MSDEWRRTLVQALVLGVVAAVVVWFLEDFNRRRLVADWNGFIEGWGAGQAGPQHG